ncbi:hypothetical protein WICPIJ_008762 [Wickerhamomyces pijperi]|uniref:Uncharacterized protein n=1 Tax=Wickerhamomyces pijperi TaxID=599730 RepID=A0A9P8THF3_WICPI|nr:hypothetical protein WICPIJ_008762 [Wickerhamomyces pijperi]
MSSRKLKSFKIVTDPQTDSDDETDNPKPQLTAKPIQFEKKIQRSKLFKPKKFQDDENSEDEIEQLKLPLKKKFKPSIPIFNHFDEDTDVPSSSYLNTEELKKQFGAQKQKNQSNVPAPQRTEVVNAEGAILPNDHNLKTQEDYITLSLDPEKDDVQEVHWERSMDAPDLTIRDLGEILDDGRLALTENESMMQKKLEEMEIKHEMYQAQVDLYSDEDVNNWETSKMTSADLGGKIRTNKFGMPKLSSIGNEETLSQHIENIKKSIQELSNQSHEIQEGIEREEVKLSGLTDKYNDLVSQVDSLGSFSLK